MVTAFTLDYWWLFRTLEYFGVVTTLCLLVLFQLSIFRVFINYKKWINEYSIRIWTRVVVGFYVFMVCFVPYRMYYGSRGEIGFLNGREESLPAIYAAFMAISEWIIWFHTISALLTIKKLQTQEHKAKFKNITLWPNLTVISDILGIGLYIVAILVKIEDLKTVGTSFATTHVWFSVGFNSQLGKIVQGKANVKVSSPQTGANARLFATGTTTEAVNPMIQ
jgi:hypothetical protein